VKRSKYRAIPTVTDGIRFASKREAARYSELRLLEKAGEIASLELQPVYPLTVNGKHVCKMIADFRYLDGGKHGKLTVEDCKGFKTPVFRLKAKLFEAIYGIELRIT
jgi:hypothetical protein